MSNSVRFLLIAVLLAGAWAALSRLGPETEDHSCCCDLAGGGCSTPIEASATSHANKYRFPEGKPTWLLVTSAKAEDSRNAVAAFEKLRTRLKGKAYFRRLDWNAKGAEPVIEQFSLGQPPASVIADAHGHVVHKLEGAHHVRKVEETLKSLIK
jgi:hypothetical protein